MKIIGLQKGAVILDEHNTEWGKLAIQFIQYLKNLFGLVAIDIQHIGSTAIKDIKAKPIIDIAVGVTKFSELEKIIPLLSSCGIEKSPSQPFDNVILFSVDEDDKRVYNVPVVIYESELWHKYIFFRDFMNANPHQAHEYNELKEILSKQYPNDIHAYMNGKQDFIKNIIKLYERTTP